MATPTPKKSMKYRVVVEVDYATLDTSGGPRQEKGTSQDACQSDFREALCRAAFEKREYPRGVRLASVTLLEFVPEEGPDEAEDRG